ncbi:MAG TPA: glycoside hydrolase family 30 protein [Novosphingobium sp.]|nr:glycoside hydrolase family 30 protein [Novosphingobium sp.]
MIDRRCAIKLAGAGAAAALVPGGAAMGAAESGQGGGTCLLSTTQGARWVAQPRPVLEADDGDPFSRSFAVALEDPRQTMRGFGAAFSEMGWAALGALPPAERGKALDQLFGAGARLTHCRMPIGSSDMAHAPYSYAETPGDFALRDFSLGRDTQALVPFIQAAQAREPQLVVWGSPWSPPRWMKTNNAFEMAPGWPGKPGNGLAPDQQRHEGEDAFIQQPRYFEAYARYFGRYVDAYAQHGIRIAAVMPQNEFNSAQPYVSCVWTPEGLARFLPWLGREMGPRGVDVLLGTLERGNAELVARVLADPAAAAVVRGLGVQWAGRGALADIARRWPQLPVWGSEQECGIGTNDWQYARYTWRALQDYLKHGACVWTYWNMALAEGGQSIAGWPQNALVAVDAARGRWRLTHDYWALRHTSAFVRPGARYLPTPSFIGYEFQTAFRNPDGSLVVVMLNDMAEPQPRKIAIGHRQIRLSLPADSFTTLVLSAQEMAAAGLPAQG